MERQILDEMAKEDVTNLLGEGWLHKPMNEYAEKGYSVRYYTRDPERWPNDVFIVIYNLDDTCIGYTTEPTFPY